MTETQYEQFETEAAASTRLRELEVKYDLFKYTVDGHSAWRLLRWVARLSLYPLPFQRQEPSKWYRFSRLLSPGISGLPAFLSPKPARYVVKIASSALSEKEDGNWKDIYFDDLLQDIGNFFKIGIKDNPLFNDRYKTALIPIDMTDSTISLLAAIFAKVFRSELISQVAKKMAVELRDEPDLQFLHSRLIAERLHYFYWAKRMYKRLFNRIHPEYVFVTNTTEYAICAAAKELGIKTVEVQHGIFNSSHPDALPRSALPYKPTLFVPDKIFLQGDFWKEKLKTSGFYDSELCVVGSNRMETYRLKRTAYKKTDRDDAICHMVMTTQGYAVNELIRFISEFLDLAEDQLNYHLDIKLHPFYDTDRSIYADAFASNPKVKVIPGADELSTFDLLARADLHLSISSACHYDAIGLCVPTVVLGLPNHEIVLNLVEAGHAKIAHTPKDLIDIALRWADLSVPHDVSSFYFKPDALANYKRELGL